jgi:hypothetical protein
VVDNVDNSQRISTDIEFSGALNKAVSHDQNKNFGLLLAMLQQNALDRSLFVKENKHEHYEGDVSQLNHYRSPDLLTESHHWQQQSLLSHSIGNNDLTNAKLWSCLFPPPLSMHNDRYRIDDEVKINTSYQTQRKLELQIDDPVQTDPTQLYDILNTLSEV